MSGFKDSSSRTPLFSSKKQGGIDFPLKVFLYSHDSVGLGHLRRNLAIAGEIATTFPNSSMMIVTGSPCATQFQLPPNTDLVKIPSISKDKKGRYITLNLSDSLQETLKFRSNMILETFRSFKPGLVIMDHQLTGLKGEALEMLREAKNEGVLTFYGLRDVKDDPEVVKQHWDTPESRWALNECYDRVCIYGVPEVFDPCVAFAPYLDKVKHVDFTGYIVPEVKKVASNPIPRRRKKVLVTFGGGSDGEHRAQRYVQALATSPAHWDSHIITGPLMDADIKRRLRDQAKKIQPIGSIKVQRFHSNIPALLQQVDAVVSMAGYNSCAEILQSGVPAVLLPRSFPRKEQVIRATRMAELGWVTALPAADPDPDELFSAVESALESSRRSQPATDLDGLGRLCDIILEQLQTAGLVENMTQLEHPKSRVM